MHPPELPNCRAKIRRLRQNKRRMGHHLCEGAAGDLGASVFPEDKGERKGRFFLVHERRRPSAQEHGRLVVSPPYHYGNPEPKVKPRTHSTATKITTPIGEVGTHATLTPPIASSVFRNTVTQAQAEPPAWWSCWVHLSHLNTMTTFREITMSHYLLLTTTLLVRPLRCPLKP